MLLGQWEKCYSITGGAEEVPKNDGISNLLKYLFYIDPTHALDSTDRAALPAIEMISINNIP